jgi:hypothetical protein
VVSRDAVIADAAIYDYFSSHSQASCHLACNLYYWTEHAQCKGMQGFFSVGVALGYLQPSKVRAIDSQLLQACWLHGIRLVLCIICVVPAPAGMMHLQAT